MARIDEGETAMSVIGKLQFPDEAMSFEPFSTTRTGLKQKPPRFTVAQPVETVRLRSREHIPRVIHIVALTD